MKKSLLNLMLGSLAVLGIGAASPNTNAQTALNAYAYDVSVAKGETQTTVKYRLNSTASDVKIQMFANGENIGEVQGQKVTNGVNEVAIPASQFPKDQDVTFKIAVTSAVVSQSKIQPYGTAYQFYHPQGVEVDNNPNSPYFGRVYVTECMTASDTKYHSHNETDHQGVYMFTPQIAPIKNSKGTFAFRGGVEFQSLFPKSEFPDTKNGKTAYDPRKIRLTEDGRLFLTGQNQHGNILWELNPKDMNANFVSVIKGTYDKNTYEIQTANGAFLAAPNVGFDVKGAGENLKLLMLSTNKNGINFSQSGFRCDEYALGTSKSWTSAPKEIKALSKKYSITYTNTSVEYDNEGGIWYVSNRSTPSASQPTLVHVNASGIEDYKIPGNGDADSKAGGAGIRFNKDFTRLAIANNPKTITIFTVGKTSDGKPKLTKEYSFSTTIGGNCNDIAWDIADNLYIVGNSSEWFKVIPLPRTSGVVVTPAADKYVVNYTSPKLEARNAYAYDVKVTQNETDITVSYRLSSPASEVKVQVLANGAIAKEVAGTTLAEYGADGTSLNNLNHVTISKEDLVTFSGVELSFNVAVTSEALKGVTFSEKAYRFYHPASVEIDNNPDSPYFGRVYVTEAMPTAEEVYHSHDAADRQGVYMFDQQLNPIKNANGTYAFRGGVTFQELFSTGTQSYDARKIRLSEDGRLFLTGQNENGAVLWEMNPDDMNANFASIIKGTYDPNTWELHTSDGKFIAGPNVGFDVKGYGKNLKLVMLSLNKNFSVHEGYRTDEYTLGTANEWVKEPQNIAALSLKYTIWHSNTSVEYDNEGGIWYCNSRANPSTIEPALVHVNAKGVEDYVVNTEAYYGGGAIRFNPDFTRLAIATGKGVVTIFTVGKDKKGAPTLTKEFDIQTTMGRNTNDIAWDIADNLYMVGNSGEWFKTISLPRTSGVANTPAAEKYNMILGDPAKLYMIGCIKENPDEQWDTADNSVVLQNNGEAFYSAENVQIYPEPGNSFGYFAITAKVSQNEEVAAQFRYGPQVDKTEVSVGKASTEEASDLCLIPNTSFKVAPGKYNIYIKLKELKIALQRYDITTGVEQIIDATAVVGGNGEIRIIGEAQNVSIYGINGQNIVTNSAEKAFSVNAGVYVVVVDGKAVKVLVR